MDRVDYICFSIIGFLTCICLIMCLYETIPECIKYYKTNKKKKQKLHLYLYLRNTFGVNIR